MKKLLSIILAFTMVLSLNPLSAHAENKNHWADGTIQNWYNLGLTDASVDYDSPLNRIDFFKLINALYNLPAKADVKFTDMSEANESYNEALKASHYINGYPDGSFKPYQAITREEAATIITALEPYRVKGNPKQFTDSDNIGDWALDNVDLITSNGYFNGYPDGSFRPKNTITYAEAVTILEKMRTDKDTVAFQIYKNGVTVYNEKKEYASADEVITTEGDGIIVTDGVTLSNQTISGDLFIAKTVGNGDINLNDVTIKGKLYIYGGGGQSVHMSNVVSNEVIADFSGVRLDFKNGCKIGTVTLLNSANVDCAGSTALIDKLVLSGQMPENSSVALNGVFNNVQLNTPNADLNVKGGKIADFSVGKDISNPNVNLGSGVIVSNSNNFSVPDGNKGTPTSSSTSSGGGGGSSGGSSGNSGGNTGGNTQSSVSLGATVKYATPTWIQAALDIKTSGVSFVKLPANGSKIPIDVTADTTYLKFNSLTSTGAKVGRITLLTDTWGEYAGKAIVTIYAKTGQSFSNGDALALSLTPATFQGSSYSSDSSATLMVSGIVASVTPQAETKYFSPSDIQIALSTGNGKLSFDTTLGSGNSFDITGTSLLEVSSSPSNMVGKITLRTNTYGDFEGKAILTLSADSGKAFDVGDTFMVTLKPDIFNEVEFAEYVTINPVTISTSSFMNAFGISASMDITDANNMTVTINISESDVSFKSYTDEAVTDSLIKLDGSGITSKTLSASGKTATLTLASSGGAFIDGYWLGVWLTDNIFDTELDFPCYFYFKIQTP